MKNKSSESSDDSKRDDSQSSHRAFRIERQERANCHLPRRNKSSDRDEVYARNFSSINNEQNDDEDKFIRSNSCSRKFISVEDEFIRNRRHNFNRFSDAYSYLSESSSDEEQIQFRHNDDLSSRDENPWENVNLFMFHPFCEDEEMQSDSLSQVHVEEQIENEQQQAVTCCNAYKKGMINDDIMCDYSTTDGLSIYEEDLELNMQK